MIFIRLIPVVKELANGFHALLIYARVEIFHLIWSKIWAVWAVFLDNYAQNLASKWAVWAVFERFIYKKPLKNRSRFEQFWAVYLKKNSSKTAQGLIIKSRPQRDSNPQSSDSKSDALSVRPCCPETSVAQRSQYKLRCSLVWFSKLWFTFWEWTLARYLDSPSTCCWYTSSENCFSVAWVTAMEVVRSLFWPSAD